MFLKAKNVYIYILMVEFLLYTFDYQNKFSYTSLKRLETQMKTTQYAYDVIPLSKTIFNTYTNNFYIYLIAVKIGLYYMFYNFEEGHSNTYFKVNTTNNTKYAAREASGLSRVSFDAAYNNMPHEIKLTDEFIYLMPRNLLDDFINWLRFESGLAPRAYNSYARLYCWLCFNIAAQHKYQSIETLSKDLGMSTKDICHRLKVLEDAKLINRSTYVPRMLARIYSLNEKNDC